MFDQSFKAAFHIFNRLNNEFDKYSMCILLPMSRYSLFSSVAGFHLTRSTGRGVGLPNFIKFDHIVVRSLDIRISPSENICCLPLKIPQRRGNSELWLALKWRSIMVKSNRVRLELTLNVLCNWKYIDRF